MMFFFDPTAINWQSYIQQVQLPGVRRHVMKQQGVQCGTIWGSAFKRQEMTVRDWRTDGEQSRLNLSTDAHEG